MLSEWKILPEYLLANWSEEKLVCLLGKRADKLEAQLERLENPKPKVKKVSDVELFQAMGVTPKVRKA